VTKITTIPEDRQLILHLLALALFQYQNKRTMKITLLLGTLTGLILMGGWTFAQSNFEVQQTEMKIVGTSSLHDWTSDVTQVNAEGKLDLNDGGELEGIENLVVTIPVTSIESEKGNIMDKKTYKALESDDHPTITYQLTKIEAIEKTDQGFQFLTQGKLTIAGATRTIDMTVKGKKGSNGALHFDGEKALKMTDYNIDPPTALFGQLETGDEIRIKFSLSLNTNLNQSN